MNVPPPNVGPVFQPIGDPGAPRGSLPHSARGLERPNLRGSTNRSNKAETRSPDTADVNRLTAAKNTERGENTTEPGTEGEARGVLRLLEAGHFRGVADVRLRINFFDEMSSITDAAALPVVQEQAREIVTAVEAAVDELVLTLTVEDGAAEGVAGAVQAFGEGVQTIVDDAISAGPAELDALVNEIKSMFAELLEQLELLLAAPPSESEATPETEAENEEDTDADLLFSLREAFDDALASLQSSITDASRLSDPSPPKGQGGAYDKFLAIYDELRGVTPSIDATI